MNCKMTLTEEQRAILEGEKGEVMAKVMETVIRDGELFGADKLIPITGNTIILSHPLDSRLGDLFMS